MDEIGAHWLISGRVQGVGFRWFVLQSARRHGLRGDVHNLRDGKVEVRAAGTAAAIEAFHADLAHGPPGARVESVERLNADRGLRFETFEVRH